MLVSSSTRALFEEFPGGEGHLRLEEDGSSGTLNVESMLAVYSMPCILTCLYRISANLFTQSSTNTVLMSLLSKRI